MKTKLLLVCAFIAVFITAGTQTTFAQMQRAHHRGMHHHHHHGHHNHTPMQHHM